jgi:pSer/pThr/pTyr-binding forkhead associated (FHA) protein
MQVVLVMFTAQGERRSFSLPRSITVIGRKEDCDIRIPLSEVSRRHCRLLADEEVLRVEDMGSSNGTFLNGMRVQEAVVQPGDSLQVGPIVFIVQIDGVPADEEIQPVPAVTGQAAGPAVAEEPAEQDEGDEIIDLELDQMEEEQQGR